LGSLEGDWRDTKRTVHRGFRKGDQKFAGALLILSEDKTRETLVSGINLVDVVGRCFKERAFIGGVNKGVVRMTAVGRCLCLFSWWLRK